MRKPLITAAVAFLLSAGSLHVMAQEGDKPADAPAAQPAAPAEGAAPAAKPEGEAAKPSGDAAKPEGAVVDGAKVPDAAEREEVGSDASKEKQGPDEFGKYTTAEGVPTYNIKEDGTTDWFTYGGFRLYHAECHVCHGPEAMGSSFAPALMESLKTMTYEQFLEVVSSGRKREGASGNSVMPAFGANTNVICFVDDLYVYLKARADGALKPGRPAKKDNKTEAQREQEEACRG
jgi:methanol metabolism-related c-type cytochrome